MEQPTEPGFYWAKVEDEWQTVRVARWYEANGKTYGLHVLLLNEESDWPVSSSPVTEWGPRVELPEGYAGPPASLG